MGPISDSDLCLIAAAGPLITIAQGAVGFWLVRRQRSQLGFALLYMAFFMRLLATGLTLFNPNDEARVGQFLGVGTWTLPVTVVAGLFILFLFASRELKLGFREQFFCFFVSSAVTTLIVGVDMAFWRRG